MQPSKGLHNQVVKIVVPYCGGGGGVLLVHNEIPDIPIGDGWVEVLVRNVLHYVPGLQNGPITHPHPPPPPTALLQNIQQGPIFSL
jgi:hypothetical protein